MWLLVVLIFAICFLLIRLIALQNVQLDVVWSDEITLYEVRYVPSLVAMVLHPRYQLLWTKVQWLAWVKAQGVAA